MDDRHDFLKDAADWYYETCGLYEDEGLDPDDCVEVLKRAFCSSDCDDFAYVLSRMTGWDCVRASWQIPDWGFGHHTLVRSPDGRLLDVAGWTDEKALSRRYGGKKKTVEIELSEVSAAPGMPLDSFDEDGIEPTVAMISRVIRSLPYAPFDEAWFLEMTLRPLEGADRAVSPSSGEPSGPGGAGGRG